MRLDPDFATEYQTFSDRKFNLNGNAKFPIATCLEFYGRKHS